MEEQIKAELAKIRHNVKTGKVQVSRTLHTDSGSFTVTFEIDSFGFLNEEEEIDIGVCVTALRAEEAVIRHAAAAGDWSQEYAAAAAGAVRQGFSQTVAQLVGRMLSKGKSE